MAIITADDIAALKGVTYTDDQKDQLNLTISYIQGELEAYLGNGVESASYTDTLAVDLYTPQVYLKHRPVTAVSSVTAEGTTVASGYYAVKSYGLDFSGIQAVTADPIIWTPSYAPYNFGVLTATDSNLLAMGGHPVGNWVVQYTAGYDGANEPALKLAVMRGTIREHASITGGFSALYTKISVEDYSVQLNERMAMQMVGAFTPGELKSLQRFRRKIT